MPVMLIYHVCFFSYLNITQNIFSLICICHVISKIKNIYITYDILYVYVAAIYACNYFSET